MYKCVWRTAFVVLVLATPFLCCSQASGHAISPADPIFGTWKMDVTRSVNNRGGKHLPFLHQATRILTPEGGDRFRMSLATSPVAKPLIYTGRFDGKDYPDPRGPGKHRTLAHWLISPNLIVRLEKTNGLPDEWVIYTVSPDGNTFTSLSWVPAHPELQNVQIFTRAK